MNGDIDFVNEYNAKIEIDDNIQKILDKYIDDLKKSEKVRDLDIAFSCFYWDLNHLLMNRQIKIKEHLINQLHKQQEQLKKEIDNIKKEK